MMVLANNPQEVWIDGDVERILKLEVVGRSQLAYPF
jgi:hypothetical protein